MVNPPDKRNVNETAVSSTLNPIARIILLGVYDNNSSFSMLQGIPHVLELIWENLVSYWKKHIHNVDESLLYWWDGVGTVENVTLGYVEKHIVEFPKPTDININMMPFIIAKTRKKCRLPKYLKPYWRMIDDVLTVVLNYDTSQKGKIAYLTIHESFVEKGTSQRRPALHTESPGIVYIRQEEQASLSNKCFISEGGGQSGLQQIQPIYAFWGLGEINERYHLKGGIYMASSVSDSCAVWDCTIQKGDDGEEIIGKLGDIEHLRKYLPKPRIMQKNTIYWLTDRTPHESLPLKNDTYRQYFRIVTSDVSIWYKDHSTENPKGVKPDMKITKIVKGSKFDDENCVVIVS